MIELRKRGPDQVKVNSLNDRQRRFAAEYMKDRNGTQAAIRAGYPEKGASVSAVRLLRHPVISKMVGAAERKALKVIGLERTKILEKLRDSLHRDLHDLCDDDGIIHGSLKQIPKHVHCFIDGFDVKQFYDEEGNITRQEIKVRLTPNAAIQDMAMKHIGAYAAEKTEVKHSVDWASLYGLAPEGDGDDPVEEQIRLLEQEGLDDE